MINLILDRYIARSVLLMSMVALLGIVSLDMFIVLIDEMDSLKGNYGFWEALRYVWLTAPRRIYEFFPLAGLLGSLIALGLMSSHSELVVMRASGVTVWRLAMSVLKVATLLMILVTLLGEYVAPITEQWGQRERAIAREGQPAVKTKFGSWVRFDQSFFHIKNLFSNEELHGVVRYDFSKEHKLEAITVVDEAHYQKGIWHLQGVRRTFFLDNQVNTQTLAEDSWQQIFNPDVLQIVSVQPKHLSVSGLLDYIRYLKDNHLDSTRFQLEFWTKLFQPLAMAVMMFVAIPFVLVSPRAVPMGFRIVLGVMVGFTFHILNQIFKPLSIVYAFPPVLGALLPLLVFLGVGIFLMRRVR